MNPLVLGGVAIAAIALLKKKAPASGSGVALKPLPPSDSKQPTDASYLTGDVLKISTLIGGGLAAIGGGSASGGLSIVGSTATGVVSSAGLVLIPVSIVIALLVAGIIGARTAQAKSMVQLWKNFLPSARHMVFYENAQFQRLANENRIAVSSIVVQDPRMNMKFIADGQEYNYIGERNVYTKVTAPANAVDFLTVQKAMRAVALYYTFECAKYATAVLRSWAPKIAFPPDFELAPKDFWLNHMYDDLPGYENAKLGGLNQVPLAGGYTEVTRADPNDLNPLASQLRGVNTAPLAEGEVAAWLNEARFVAFKNVLETIHQDNALYFPWDPIRYAKDVYTRFNLTSPRFILNGTKLTLPYSEWGFSGGDGAPCHINVDIINVKDNGPMASWFQTKA